MRAYNIKMLERPFDRADPEDRGWCFGLPPGIAPEQWPLDPNNGYPLAHAFTLRLPDDYRCHGPEIVALSFFGTPCDMNDGSPAEAAAIKAAFAKDAPQPADPELAALWAADRRRHPRAHRMEDILGCAYGLLLLTEAEFAGPECRPPAVLPCAHREGLPRPRWLDIGTAAGLWTFTFPRWKTEPYESYGLYRDFGRVPPSDLAYNRALRYAPRAEDPNAGVPTCDPYDAVQTGYQPPFRFVTTASGEDEYREHDWAKDHAHLHIGGTMEPCQQVPRFSPFHIGFSEEFGGFNFGGGTAQIDFKDMKFDWACG